jgi:hypothetical protein
MMKRGLLLLLLFVFGLALFPAVSQAVPPLVKTVPWVATNPLIPHDTWSGKSIRLKGTSDVQGANIQYTWDFGDGSAVQTGTVGNMYAIEASHAYSGPVGTVFTARLTVQNTTTNETASALYYVKIEEQTLAVEVNVAIDEGLWYLHKTMIRTASDGYWPSYWAVTPARLNAFFVNGHLETGSTSNPYTETVQRGMRRLFTLLYATSIGNPANQTYPFGTFNTDSNSNGLAIYTVESYTYAGGIYIDAIVASGTPDAVALTGNANVIGRTYKDIVQDLVDGYVYGQTDQGNWMGGWGYDWNNWNSDNSVNQWAAIGLLGAERWGITIPVFVKQANMISLNNTQATTANCGAAYDGAFAYTNNYCYFPWGPWGTTPAGMVQMVMDGIERGDAQWDRTENYVRNNFCNEGESYQAMRRYYYGLFSFTKSMLLYPGGPIKFLANQPGNTNPIDWYAAETSKGDPCNGVARTLVSDQLSDGNWGLHNAYGYHEYFSAPWAIIMLNRTVFESGVPVAVAQAVPNPGVVGQIIQLSGAGSFHQDASRIIDSWEWDLDNDGVYDVSGPSPTVSFSALGNYVIVLRVTDDGSPEKSATTTVTVRITTPPIAPTADAGGPYSLCPGAKPWFLDATGSVNPDEGEHEFGMPGDTIQSYDWDLDGDGQFDDATGAQPDVTVYFTATGPGSHLIQLKVTDTTATSFPSSGYGNLVDTDSAVVVVRGSTDPECTCVSDLVARAKDRKIQLVWTHTGAASYNVYRSTVSGGPYVFIANTTSTYSTYLDTGLTNGTRYYYVVREVAANTDELCQSNQANAVPRAIR